MVFINGEKTDMLRCFYLSSDNCRQASNLYNNRYTNRRHPHYRTFLNLHVSLATFGSFEKPKNIRFRNAGNNEEEELNSLAHFRAFPTTSTREATRELNIWRHKIRKTGDSICLLFYGPTSQSFIAMVFLINITLIFGMILILKEFK
ncbi:hypothetical protein ABEB36_010798 [Hypothenemus hampei]|uniref:DUF4817 domain-containing protein n=1 Tax=Hypothenemus hampei TaxID=57062 RepID=A0ABD1ED41_HYPHA